MTYLTSHTPVPRTLARPLNADEVQPRVPYDEETYAEMMSGRAVKVIEKRQTVSAQQSASLKVNLRIINYLKRNPSSQATDIAHHIKLTPPNVRHRLGNLINMGFVVVDENRTQGRARTYRVTR